MEVYVESIVFFPRRPLAFLESPVMDFHDYQDFLDVRIRLPLMKRFIRTFLGFLVDLILGVRIIELCISFLIRTHHAKAFQKSQIVRIKPCFKSNLIRTSQD